MHYLFIYFLRFFFCLRFVKSVLFSKIKENGVLIVTLLFLVELLYSFGDGSLDRVFQHFLDICKETLFIFISDGWDHGVPNTVISGNVFRWPPKSPYFSFEHIGIVGEQT